jgi:hypothetical protein
MVWLIARITPARRLQWLKDLYQQNKLVKNEFELGTQGGSAEDHDAGAQYLRQEDHIIPPQSSGAGRAVGTKDYSEIDWRAATSACSSAATGRAREGHVD